MITRRFITLDDWECLGVDRSARRDPCLPHPETPAAFLRVDVDNFPIFLSSIASVPLTTRIAVMLPSNLR